MGVFSAFGMAVRRWYLLIPLVLAGVGVSWLAYSQMPASYSATVVHEVRAAEPAAASSSTTTRRGVTLAPPKSAPDASERTSDAAAELVGSVRPQPPAGSLPGRSHPQPVTLARQPDASSVTVTVVADSAVHAREAAEAITRQLTDRLRELDEERGADADEQLSLATTSPLAVQPPIRTVGRRVFVVTLAFCVMLSVVLAAAVERSARRRRLLLAQDSDAEAPGDDADPEGAAREGAGRVEAAQPARARAGRGTDRNAAQEPRGGRAATAEPDAAPEALPEAEPELLSGAEPALLADARPPLSAGSPPPVRGPKPPVTRPGSGSRPPPVSGPARSPVPVGGRAVPPGGPPEQDDSAPTDLVPLLAGDDGPSTAVIPAAVGAPAGGPGRALPHDPSRSPSGPEREPVPQPTGGHPVADPTRAPVPSRPGRVLPPRGGRAPMDPRPAPPAEVGVPSASRARRPGPAGHGDGPRPWSGSDAPVDTGGWLPPGAGPVAVEAGP